MAHTLTDDAFCAHVGEALREIPGVEAVMLGGSRAGGAHTAESDWDFSIYYRGHFDVEGVRALGFPGQVFPLGGWGGGVFNGGAWLTVDDRAVDVHYRDLNDVERRMRAAELGHFEIEHLAHYLAGIPTYVVVAELALGRVLSGDLERPNYPEALKRTASARWSELATMTLRYATRVYAARGDVLGCAGAAARAVLEASHARLAARGSWITNEKTLAARAGLGGAACFLERLSATPEALAEALTGIAALIAE